LSNLPRQFIKSFVITKEVKTPILVLGHLLPEEETRFKEKIGLQVLIGLGIVEIAYKLESLAHREISEVFVAV
jgi:hypothetical protein